MERRVFKQRLRKKFIVFLLIFLSSLFCTPGSYASEYRVVRGIVDVHSNMSDGLYSLEKIAESAREEGISVLIFTDSALRKWEYGLWPLRSLIKRTTEDNSVLRLGIERYLRRFAALREEFPGLVFVPGLEVSPFYYWKGNPLSRNFSLNDYHKQFLVIGLGRKDYQNMPILGNRSRFNQYQGQQGIRPYQGFIDYVNEKKGLIFWAHPQMPVLQKYKGIDAYTPVHPEDLLLSRNYTGFGVTFTSKLNIAEVGGVWDKILLEYIEGKRKKPVWIIGSLHYDGPSRRIDDVETLFFIKQTRNEDILDALKQGRMYVRFNSGNPSIVLKEFSVKNLNSESIQISIKGTQVPSSGPIRIELISNGEVFKIFDESRDEWTIVVEDNLSPQKVRRYYRLKISSPKSLILSNPVFTE